MFPFPDGAFPAELGAVVQRTVLIGELPALVVIHDDEGDWLVGDGINDPNVAGACVVAHMTHVVERNSSVALLATLPVGHMATRSAEGEPWTVEAHVWPEDDEVDAPSEPA